MRDQHVIPTDPGAGFSFECTLRLAETDYARLEGDPLRPGPRAWGRLAALTAVGLALLCYAPTRFPGVLVLLVAGAALLLPRIGRAGQARMYRDAAYLHGPTTHGVSDAGVWFAGGSLRAESTWAGVRVWDRRNGHLLLAATGMPRVCLPEAELRTAGLEDRVLALARRHAVEFNSPAARAGSRPPAA